MLQLHRLNVHPGLRAKLLGSVLLYLALLALVGLLGLYAAQASLAGFDIALQHHVREISVLSDVAEEVHRAHSTALLHVVAETPEDRARYEQRLASLDANVEGLLDEQLQIEQRFSDQSDVERIQRFRDIWHAYLEARDRDLLPLSRDNRDTEALRLIEPNGAFDQTYQRVTEELSNVQDTLEAESHDRLEDSEAVFARNRDLLVVTLLVAGLFGIGFGLRQSPRLARTIRAVSGAAHRVATGDFSQRVEWIRTGDEVESLADSFNTMTANLERMDAEQREVERLKDEFVSMVSHELRTPMNGVIGMTDLLLAAELGPRERRYAEAVRRSGDALLTIVNDILDFSKIEAGKLQLDCVAFDVREIVGDVLGLFSERAAAKHVELTSSFGPDLPPLVVGDPGRLRQVLTNLAGNAVKFTPAGVVRVSVQVASLEDGRVCLRYQVTDTGIGIAPEAVARLFEPFTQADGSTTRTYGGTGLGLSICRRLVGLMGGGEIAVESHPGLGSTFAFSLSHLVADASALADAPRATDVVRVPRAPTASPRVLLVEDSWINQQVALGMLEQLGYEADVVDNGRAALRVLAAGTQYAAVLMDCQMPGLDGYQTTAEIRRHEAETGQSTRVPIVALTASAMAGDRERCLAAGMSDYLPKPVSLTDMARMLAHWAGQPEVDGSTGRASTGRESTGRESTGHAPTGHAPTGRESTSDEPTSDEPTSQGPIRDDRTRDGSNRAEPTREAPAQAVGSPSSAQPGGSPSSAQPGGSPSSAQADGPAQGAAPTQDPGRVSLGTNGDSPILDPTAIETLRRLQRPGRPDLVAAVFERFEADLPARLETLHAALDAHDPEAVWHAAHALKGDSGRIGARQVQHFAAEIERLGRLGQLDAAPALLSDLEAAVARLQPELHACVC